MSWKRIPRFLIIRGGQEFPGGDDYALTGAYRYSLVEMAGDEIPELLLEAEGGNGKHPVRVFTTTDGVNVVSPEQTLLTFVATAGGERAHVYAALDGTRIFQLTGQSVGPTYQAEAYAMSGENLVSTGEKLDLPLDDTTTFSPLEWFDLSDRGPLAALEPTLAGDQPATAPAPSIAPAAADNVVSGTVRVMNAAELAYYQGFESTPNGETEKQEFAVLVLDEATMFTAASSGGPSVPDQKTATIIGLGERGGPSEPYYVRGFGLEGQHLTLAANRNDCGWPSDISFPLGQPRCTGGTLKAG
ncbi:hypothetical protein CDOO_00515 [Corynebacterium doosanense CAU 212 = DSM 45436]|uniref:Uncharacterized protein n=1 Tax=Corynebacterium doosanense CAU 212 = DSM 45436 TaxID=558173 RepID=A0A097IJ23_9CORY|nr:hypothetical protein CDOO_00515 [Corynebacterium doosanense CAU 212 = DSM 45436]